MAKVRHIYDTETGEEILERGRFIPEKQDLAINKRRSAKANEDKQGEFIWVLFTYCDEIFPNLSKPSVARLFYISTFVEYDGNRLTDDGGYTFFNKRRLKGKLNLTDRSFTGFWNEMVENNILTEDKDKRVVINSSLFKKGNIDKRCKSDFTRLYCQCVRRIYESTNDIRDHSRLSYIFKVIPYVNRKTNIVCYNPEEQDNQKIVPMTIGDFCDVVGYSKANAARLFNELSSFSVKGKHLMCYVGIGKFNISSMFIIINPEIYYGGQEHHNAQFIFDVCDKEKYVK